MLKIQVNMPIKKEHAHTLFRYFGIFRLKERKREKKIFKTLANLIIIFYSIVLIFSNTVGLIRTNLNGFELFIRPHYSTVYG